MYHFARRVARSSSAVYESKVQEIQKAAWTFLSNHTHVLVCLARDSEIRLRDIADQVGITERAVTKLLSELESAGVITRKKEGRRNVYTIHPEQHFRHPIEANTTVGDLINLVNTPRSPSIP